MTIEKLNATFMLGYRLLKEHGLAEKGWTFDISYGKRQVGWCDYEEKKIAHSIYFIQDTPMEEIENTIRHEIAHALVGPDVKSHGPEWKFKAIEVGARPEACTSQAINSARPNYRIRCANCNRLLGERHRRKRSKRKMYSLCCHADIKWFRITYTGRDDGSV